MIKTLGKLTLATILAAVVVGVPLSARAQDKTPAPSAPAATPKARPIPFRGKLGEVDKVNKTITLDEKTKRTFEVTSETKITKSGKPATLDDAVVGEDVAGQYIKNADGKMTLRSVRFGPKAAPPAAK